MKHPSKPEFTSDSNEIAQLISAGKRAAANAIRTTKALGLEITYLENGVIYKESPNGTSTLFMKVEHREIGIKQVKQVKKGMVFTIKKHE